MASAVGSVASSIIGGQAQENVADKQFEQSKYATDADIGERKREFGQTTDVASKQLAETAAGINDATSSTPEELLNLKTDIENGTSRNMQNIAGQVGANLATSGVRGGQAATLQNRAVGEAGIAGETNIDQLLAEDAAQRRAAKTGYLTTIGSGAISHIGG